MKTTLLKVGLMVIILCSITGCWSKVELDQRIFVNGVFVDVGEEPGTVKVSISTPLTNRLDSDQLSGGGGGKDKPYSLITKQSTSIGKALEYIHKDLSRQLSLSEIKVVMISEQYGEQGIGDLLEWIKREPDVPIGAYLLVASGKLDDAAHLTPIFEQLPTTVLLSFATQGYMLNTTIKDCLVADAAGLGYAATLLQNDKIHSAADAHKSETWTGIKGAALFQQGLLKGTLPYEEAKTIAWAHGHLKFPIYSVQWDHGKSKADLKFTYTNGKTSVKMTPNGPVFTVHLKGRASIIAKKDASHRFVKDVSGTIMNQMRETVSEDFRKSIAYSQQIGADVLQLGFLLEWNAPQYWQQVKGKWPEHYKKDAEVRVVTKLSLDDYGKEY